MAHKKITIEKIGNDEFVLKLIVGSTYHCPTDEELERILNVFTGVRLDLDDRSLCLKSSFPGDLFHLSLTINSDSFDRMCASGRTNFDQVKVYLWSSDGNHIYYGYTK